MNSSQHDDHWLVRPSTIKLLWWVSSIVLALLVVAQSVIHVKGYFGIDGWIGFGAVFGFVSCLVMVLLAKGLGLALKRSEDYYEIHGHQKHDSEGHGSNARADKRHHGDANV